MPEETNSNPNIEPKEGQSSSKVAEEDSINAIALLSYLSLLFLIPLLAAKDDEFAQYHAKQGLVLFIVSILGGFVGSVPVIGWVLAPFIAIICLVFAIMGIINVLKGEKKELPIIGQYASRFKI